MYLFPAHRESVTQAISVIHGHILRNCEQIPWAGATTEKTHSGNIEENLPRSRDLLRSRILNQNFRHNGSPGIFVGPTTYQRFLHCFRHVFEAKVSEANEKTTKRR